MMMDAVTTNMHDGSFGGENNRSSYELSNQNQHGRSGNSAYLDEGGTSNDKKIKLQFRPFSSM